MDIYLLQHAQAMSSDEDPTRPLSKVGESTINRIAEYCRMIGVTVDRIYHSEKLRAKQTAQIFANYLKISDTVEERTDLNPSDEVEPVRNWLKQLSSSDLRSVALVGHLPFLDKLTSLLVSGSVDAHIVTFQNACIVKLIPKSSGGEYTIQWILTPDIVK